MTSTLRIPKAELTGVQGSLLKMAIRKKIGRVPDNVAVMWNHPAVFKDLMRAGARTEKWDRAGRQPGVVRGDGGGLRDRVRRLPGPQLLHGSQPGPGGREGARGAALARCPRRSPRWSGG